MTFAEIERVTGVRLPGKSQHSRAWWSNNPSNNVMTKVWLDAGFESAAVDLKARKLVFKRRPQGRSPSSGAPKGLFTTEPGYDLTQPAITAEEWAEVEKEMEKDGDQIEAGMKGKGMAENAPDYAMETDLPDHPLFGCMKGTFWIDPEWDLTKPALDPEELAEWEASLDRKMAAFARAQSDK